MKYDYSCKMTNMKKRRIAQIFVSVRNYKIRGCIRFWNFIMMLTKDMLKKKMCTDEVYYLSVGNDLDRYWSIGIIKIALQEAGASLLSMI